MYKLYGKRALDLIMAIFLFLIFSPIFVLIFCLLFFTNKGAVFFFQNRPGLKGEVFKIIKFKTMKDGIDKDGNPLSDALRITRIGSLVRKTSFDELPQLFNVIKGDMSMVGPRPLLVEYLPLYNSSQLQRHNEKPGITGWAQINGRNAISWERKFELDIWYIENVNFFLDLKILLLTFGNVIRGKGVSQQGHVTVGRFLGSEK
ncbi:sugar transferase [Belliella sp. R4-6]|uniref:Sugar transferase n=1 Tax=Belliella alkalica TaxID=1730871 RepID=A0ABS9VFF4_9BACT|nr:sugar transferase [Belliella alkalica]MCH7415177.1 sugar transferase [Belliella alkalica]